MVDCVLWFLEDHRPVAGFECGVELLLGKGDAFISKAGWLMVLNVAKVGCISVAKVGCIKLAKVGCMA